MHDLMRWMCVCFKNWTLPLLPKNCHFKAKYEVKNHFSDFFIKNGALQLEVIDQFVLLTDHTLYVCVVIHCVAFLNSSLDKLLVQT